MTITLTESSLPANVSAFLDAFMAGTVENPLCHFEQLWHGIVGFEVKPHRDGIRLSCIRSLDRGHGNASEALDWFCDLADEYGVTIRGEIKAVGHRSLVLNNNQLRAWYKRHGFSVVLRSSIVRFPEGGER